MKPAELIHQPTVALPVFIARSHEMQATLKLVTTLCCWLSQPARSVKRAAVVPGEVPDYSQLLKTQHSSFL